MIHRSLANSLDGSTSLPKAIWIVGCVLLSIALLGPNTLLAVLATLVLMFGAALLWRPGEGPILLIIFLYQWLQMSISTYYGNLRGVSVNQLTTFASMSDVELATLLSEIALVALAAGMRAGAGPWNPNDVLKIRRCASTAQAVRFFLFYLISFLVAFISEAFAYVVPGLSQLLLTVTCIKWAFFFMLGYASFSTRSSKSYFLTAFGLELIWGFGGFFSDFKSVFIFTILSYTASRSRMSASSVIALALLFILLAAFTLTWTAVKMEYRNYLSGGERAQIVTVGYTERATKLLELINNLGSKDLEAASDHMISRIAYVEVFGAVLNYVPTVEPFADGSLWLDAVTRPLMPRLFFPEKAAIDDSERTNQYTGLAVSGAEQGTSISIGYMGESYIDFGKAGMIAPIFALGALLGAVYKWLVSRSAARGLLGMGLACGLLAPLMFGESSITKSFGWFVLGTLMAWLLIKYIAPRFFPWLLSGTRSQHMRNAFLH